MKTNIKIELGILFACLLGSFIFQLYVQNVSDFKDYGDLAYNGMTEDREYYVKPYTILDIDMQADVIFKKGDPKIEIETAEGWLEALTLEEENGTLILELPNEIKGSNNYRSKLTIYNNQPLEGLVLYSSVSLEYQYPDSLVDLRIRQRQASKFRGTVYTKNLNLSMSDASENEMEGRTETLTLEMRNASRLIMQNFVVSEAILELKDAARGSLTVDDYLTAESYGASQMEITGSPRIKGFSTRDASRIEFMELDDNKE